MKFRYFALWLSTPVSLDSLSSSSSLKFNAQVEWWDVVHCVHVIFLNEAMSYFLTSLLLNSYDALKRYIYHLEKQKHEALLQSHDMESATERTSLVDRIAQWQDTDALFKPLLDAELWKISSFYALQGK